MKQIKQLIEKEIENSDDKYVQKMMRGYFDIKFRAIAKKRNVAGPSLISTSRVHSANHSRNQSLANSVESNAKEEVE